MNYFESNQEDNPTSTNLDPYKILATKLISKANVQNHNQFAFSTQLDIKKPETYNRTMSKSYSFQ